MLPPHPVTQLVRAAASRTAGHQRRTWFPRASVRPMLPVTGEQTIEQESLTDDVQDEEDPEGYGFGV